MTRPPTAIAAVGGVWSKVAAAWSVATEVGAPLAESLRGVASALRDAQDATDEVRVALAEPAASARLMGWLPLVAVGLGVALGFDTVTVLLTQPAGLACLLGGLALMVGARVWSARLVARARPGDDIPGLALEIGAIAVGGGASVDRARSLVRTALPESDPTAGDDVLALSRSAGVPAAELLRAAAALARHRARTEGRMRAARLSSRLLLPLGVCTLPAFLLLGVAPMILAILASNVLSL